MLKKPGKSIIAAIISVGVVLSSLFSLSSCNSSGTSSVSSARINERGELVIVYSDGREQNVGAISNEGTTVVIENTGGSISSASSKGLASAVSITSNFKKTVNNSYGGWFPSFSYGGGSTTSDYSSEGAGVIYKLDRDTGSAFIITNYHVVYDKSSDSENGISEDIDVYLYGAEDEKYAIDAEYVGGSLYYDIAVLYVENCEALRNSAHDAPAVADSENVSVGQTAIAIGNPQGYGISASLGIVSVTSEYITMTAADDLTTVSFRVMRVDTAVNSGNSGGGLYNERGELIGIVNAKIVDTNVENIGYAIPSNIATAVADNIIDNCFEKENDTVMRALLGVTLGSENSHAILDTELGIMKISERVVVEEVASGSICQGILKAGDVIKSAKLGDITLDITRRYHIIDLMLDVRAGDTVEITVERDGKEKVVSLTITEKEIVAY